MTDKTLGGYIRTTPDPDDMDGGVAAEQIEQEADTRTREHLLHEESRLLKLEESLRAHLSRTINRAERAERERDTWKVRAEAAEPARDKWREVAKREQGMSDELARQLEATEASLREANGVVKSLHAAESRPLTPDAMTAREHLDAAWEAAHVPADGIIPEGRMFLDRGTAGVVVVGAAGKDLASHGSSWERRLVEPPTPARPEGAEEIEALLTGSYAEPRYVADFLAERGVRVVGEERS